MASYASSSSATLSKDHYDVFMSFRGEDTRMGFTSHLYDALTRKRIRTYKDDRTLEIGNPIASELLKAIETSRFAIVVMSSNFATSKWCLEEIAKVVDCMERGELIVIPVFYHVSPSDVRHQSNCFEQGFLNHEVDPEVTPQRLETWRAAFAKVGAIAGLHVTQQRNESEVVSEIVRKILKHVQDTLPTDVTNGLVGIESRVNEVKRILSMESSEVRFIGICGMSGIGKTTLAEVVYEGIRNKFQESSFIENIKDVSKENGSTNLCKLQQKLLDDILKEESIRVQSVKHGQTLLGTKLRGLKVIIVLDDVNHVDQLTYLAGGREWFGHGSRIIVTTTNIDLLNPHKVNEIYRCEELKGNEALSLFCLSAFEEGHSAHGYEKLSDDIVKLAGGLPLALNVYGSLLCRKEEDYWKEMLKKLRAFPPREVLGRLKVVYARLDRDQRDAFIYIACFLKGRDQDLVKDILTNIGLYPRCALPDLINKFLLTINHDDSVWMHDLLQQMCWETLDESSRYDGARIAIKYRKDVVNILSSKLKGTSTIEIINQEPYKVEVDNWVDDPECFSKMTKLKFLRISNIHFRHGLNYLSNDLRILDWYGCSLKSLPSTFEPEHIYELEMCSSQLETLWEKDLDLPNLRSINLSFSKDLTKIPDLTSTSNLVKLNLEGCTKLTELHESVLLQKRLRYMNLKGCTSLQSLGRSTMDMEALEALLLSGCSNLEYIPVFGQSMKRLEHLYVDGTSIKKLPDNLGEMCHLRKLDASRTSIEVLPSSIHHLKRLRLLSVHRCRLSSKTGGFLYTKMDTLSSGLRELDLSYCNLSAVPDGIGLLYHLVNLDLSGNDFVLLPASISLLSNLRMLCVNNCKKLQSLPKLSIVNEDTLFGLQIRFNYYISGEGLHVSKFHATSNNTSPTVSCLNCPKLAENESGRYLAEKILNSYLQLRTKYWITPEAVFEIVGAGSKIPSGFKPPRFDGSLILEGPWIGVAICAVIAVRHIDAYMEAKYVVTAHIYVGEKHWKIPVHINFLVAGLENQLVFYWTVADDLQRILDSRQKNKFGVSFSVEPGDGNLQVTKFGVRLIRDEDMLQLKQYEDSTGEVHSLFRATLSLPIDLRWYIRACEADTDLYSCHSIIHNHTSSIIKFILDYGKQRDSLDGIHKIIKCLLEINQEVFIVLSEFKEEWRHTQLLPLLYEYYLIIRITSDLYNDFLRLVKDIYDSWLSVKLALEQIVVKSKGNDYTYEEMLQQLNDLEAAESVTFSDNFVTLFAYVCKQTVDFSRHLNEEIPHDEKFKLVKVLAKVSSITIAGVFSMVAKCMGDSDLLLEMKDITSYSMWLHLMQSFSRKRFNPQYIKARFDRELRIRDFYGNAILLQELKNKMARFSFATKENEEEMMMVIDKLEKKIDKFSDTFENMSSQAHKYGHDIWEAGITLNQFIADGNPHVTKFGVRFTRNKDILQQKRYEDSASEAMSNLSEAIVFHPCVLQWYIHACEGDTDIYSSHSFLHKPTISIIKFILDCGKQDFLGGIHKIFGCLLQINHEGFIVLRECKEEWNHTQLFPLVYEFYEISCGTYELYCDFMRLVNHIYDSCLSVKLALEQIMQKSRAGDYTYENMLQQLDDLQAALSVGFPDNFFISFVSLCQQTAAFLRHFNLEICHNKKFNSLKVLAKVSSVTIAGMFVVKATYMGDSSLLQRMKKIDFYSMWLHLIPRFSRKNGKWFNGRGHHMMKTRNDWELRIWDFYGIVILLPELKNKMAQFSGATKENEEEMMITIDKLEKKINNFSETIEDMSSHAHKCSHDIWEAGITLGIRSKQMRPVGKRKRQTT